MDTQRRPGAAGALSQAGPGQPGRRPVPPGVDDVNEALEELRQAAALDLNDYFRDLHHPAAGVKRPGRLGRGDGALGTALSGRAHRLALWLAVASRTSLTRYLS